MRETSTDVLVIGSGFGGAMAAWPLLDAGFRVRMLERGSWRRRLESSAPSTRRDLDPFYRESIPHRIGHGGNGVVPDDFANVGGPSLYYAAVSSRFRARDFEPDPEIVGSSGAEWPFRYPEVEPFYARAEYLLGVGGPEIGGVTEPPRSAGYPQDLPPLSATSTVLGAAAHRLGYHPFRLPLAINYQDETRRRCEACAYCDGFPCLIGAKNDVAARLIPPLLARGLELEASTAAIRIRVDGAHATAVDAIDLRTGERSRHQADIVVLAAGAIASPGLVLASGLERCSSAPDLVGRYLMRHCNATVFGLFRQPPDPERRFHKELGIDDFYFGHESVLEPSGKLGMIQQMATPWVVLVLIPRLVAGLAAPAVSLTTGLLVIAEDQPVYENRVALGETPADRPPVVRVVHRHSERDLAARRSLVGKAREILREAGARYQLVQPIHTFSHAVGTLRMGTDPVTSVLDPTGRFRGLRNLYVTDGSVLPTSGGVNPSLTISALALRTACGIADERSEAMREPGWRLLEESSV